MAVSTTPHALRTREPHAQGTPQAVDRLHIAALITHPGVEHALRAARRVLHHAGIALDVDVLPGSTLKGGTVGRIGVPKHMLDAARRSGIVLAPTVGMDAMTPAARLWRGMVRRGGAAVDARGMQTLPGTPAALAGHERDLLLMSQRTRSEGLLTREDVDGWSRARATAEHVYRTAMAQSRDVVLVLPPGRVTPESALLTDACEREARTHRLPAPRAVKAGLLAAMVAASRHTRHLLIVSTMSIDELSAAVTSTIGPMGPWPVVSAGTSADFIAAECTLTADPVMVDPTGLLLACVAMLERRGVACADTLRTALRITAAAEARMRTDPAQRLGVSARDFAEAVVANWGRIELSGEGGAANPVVDEAVDGLLVRIASTLPASAVREAVQTLVDDTGLEVASAHTLEVIPATGSDIVELRLRTALGEPPVDDARAQRVVRLLSTQLRCVLVAPWREREPLVRDTTVEPSRPLHREPRTTTTGRLARRLRLSA